MLTDPRQKDALSNQQAQNMGDRSHPGCNAEYGCCSCTQGVTVLQKIHWNPAAAGVFEGALVVSHISHAEHSSFSYLQFQLTQDNMGRQLSCRHPHKITSRKFLVFTPADPPLIVFLYHDHPLRVCHPIWSIYLTHKTCTFHALGSCWWIKYGEVGLVSNLVSQQAWATMTFAIRKWWESQHGWC